eukprot:CAMPEP_0197842164 /NCGR_PEP_ID=MMETSP1437-20131217/46587_1 /TAXON_ID=49252 ORGANISM="Eucampia antarctica, Strain CCMP1452" /NCGR_SAMPLE_ID=MMETSP1437 /ASSEMBLY_ACC=CAM_ASM_001096 /LENGTH=654 /DNA_ID=CAMNT_0043452013 /DNA_START=454 /DNA_END=2418 /DNA_ORIENTATION=-
MDFCVIISASGRSTINTTNSHPTSRLIHAVSVSQPVQSWTVIRDHIDFIAVGNALSTVIGGLPQYPAAPDFDAISHLNEVDEIVKSRNELQDWLTNILLYPGARESPAVRQFLCYGANIVPPQFEGISWVSFTPSPDSNNDHHHGLETTSGGQSHNNNFDELEMDDMFGYEGTSVASDEDEEDYGHDDTDLYSAAERYQRPDETITQDDVMEFQNNFDDVEMIEDVGSLAQSLGASHLGRSLQLQAELSHIKNPQAPSVPLPQQKGVTVRGSNLTATTSGQGGIGNAMKQAEEAATEAKVEGLGDSFHQTTPVSAPRLDSFKMIKVIGKGSFGKVFLVREIKTSEMFALKVLRKDNIIKRNQVEHTRTERSVLGYVRHPFIVGLNMAFQSNDKLYFVLDYCAGGELFFHLSKVGKFAEPRARFYAAEITLAIEYVHSLDIIYRDLKPENVLLDARGHVRLTDFGLSKEGISSSSSGANSFCGTPEYLAPEILNRQGHGRAVDWWSLGALLYEMLTGLPPFYCRDREKLFEKIRKGHLDYPRSLSARSQNMLRGLLTKDPRRRLGSGPNDAADIKQHAFFIETDWNKLTAGDIQPPWDPQIHGSLDTSQFDDEFTSMPMFSPSSMQPHAGFGTTPQDNIFEGFTFTDKGFYGRRE